MSEMWDSVAKAWETNAGFVDGHLKVATEKLLDAAGVDEGDQVLDVACGPGGAGMAAASRVGPSGSVVLADDAPGMVAAAGRRSAGIVNVSTLLCGQAELTAADGTFDAVISRHGLMFAEVPAAAAKEAARVLKHGGRYAVMTWGRRSENPWLGLTLDAVSDEFGVPFPPPGVLGPFSLEDPDVLGEALREGGLADVQVESEDAPMSAASLDAWWDLVPQLAGPLAIALEGMDPGVRDSIRSRALNAAGPVADDSSDEIVLGGTVLVASGVHD